MGERKLFKTKLCDLYEKGHCPRHTCSFAHGYAELRHFSGSFNGRRDNRSGDLRDKLARRRSPPQRYPPRREARGQHASRGQSPSGSGERSDRKRHKKQHFNSESDRSGSVKVSDRTEDRVENKKLVSFEPKSVAVDELRQAQAEIDALKNQKYQLKNNLEKRVQEVDSLTSRIEELKNQLFVEKEECNRTIAKINKFIKAHKRHSRLQEELKRSYDLLQVMGDQLCVNEDASNINISNDGETTAHLIKGGAKDTIRMEKHSRWNEQDSLFDNEVADQRHSGSNGHRILYGTKSKRGKIDLINAPSEEKLKGHEPGFNLPPTSMAAHAIDEGIETADQEEDLEVVIKTNSKGFNGGATNGSSQFPFPLPLPPPLPQNDHTQYRGKDENLEVDTVEDDTFDVDIV